MKIKFEGTYEEFYSVFRMHMNEFVPSGEERVPFDDNVEVLPVAPRLVPDAVAPPEAASPGAPLQPKPLDATSRARVTKNFTKLVHAWLVGWEQPDFKEQPDRVGLLRGFATSRDAVPLLQLAYEHGSLQRVVELCLQAGWSSTWPPAPKDNAEWLDLLDRVSGHLVQISHVCYPDLEGTHDYSTAWRRAKGYAIREEE